MKIQREYWIGYDGVNDREPWIMTSKPSGISGGGSNQSIHVIQYSDYNAVKKALARLLAEIEMNTDRAFSKHCHDKVDSILRNNPTEITGK